MCTRALYVGEDNTVITGRSMDWGDDMRSNVWLFPRGMARDGADRANGLKWVSKYGSLIVSSYDIGSSDGMNEQGLVANMLYLAESDYGASRADKPELSISMWAQYVLDNFASVAEAVATLRSEPFWIYTAALPNGRGAQLHLSISDADGDSAIFEYIDGRLVTHHGKDYKVMTNTPTYEQQLAIRDYWLSSAAASMITFVPGSFNAADRFVRTWMMVDAIPQAVDSRIISAVPGRSYNMQAVGSMLGVMRASSLPLGITHPTKPNLSSTLWRTIYDHKNRTFIFDSATAPNVFWVPLGELDFQAGTAVKKLRVEGGAVYAGNAAAQFEPTEAFDFLKGQ